MICACFWCVAEVSEISQSWISMLQCISTPAYQDWETSKKVFCHCMPWASSMAYTQIALINPQSHNDCFVMAGTTIIWSHNDGCRWCVILDAICSARICMHTQLHGNTYGSYWDRSRFEPPRFNTALEVSWPCTARLSTVGLTPDSSNNR